MTDELDAVKELIDETPSSPTLVSLLERAVELSDARGDVPGAYEFRRQLTSEACAHGMPDKVLVAFAWNLAQFDRNPGGFDEHNLLWRYKWILGRLTSFPDIPLAQIEAALADFAARCRRYGATRRAELGLRTHVAQAVGDRDGTRAALADWRKAPRDSLTDCAACERDDWVGFHYFLGHHRRALQIAKPLLAGTMSCSSVPQNTYAGALVPLLRLGRADEAARYHAIGYPQVEGQPKFLWAAGAHADYRILTGDAAGAVRVFERHFPLAFVTASPLGRYHFYHSGVLLFRRLSEAGRKTRKLKLPEAFPLRNARNSYDTGELAVWFEREARALAARFDARAGNTFRTDELDGLGDLLATAQPLR